MRKCDACGQTYSSAKQWQRFCSRACRKREERRRYRAAHPERVRETFRRWDAANPERRRERDRRYRAAHPEQKRERARRYSAANPERVREWFRRFYANHPDYSREQARRALLKRWDGLPEEYIEIADLLRRLNIEIRGGAEA